jgi:hypothetical protein
LAFNTCQLQLLPRQLVAALLLRPLLLLLQLIQSRMQSPGKVLHAELCHMGV